MVDTIEKALNLLSLIIFILGCGNLRYSDHPRFLSSIFYILIVWSVYACVFYYVNIQFSLSNVFNDNYLSFFMLMINAFVTMISMIITVREHEKFRICIRKLDFVDNTFEKLGTPKEYHRLQNLIKWALVMLFITMCLSWTFDSLLCIELCNDTRAILIPLVMDHGLHINTIMDIMFMLLLRHIGTRLDKINDYIEQLSETEDCGLRWKKSLVVGSYIRSAENRKRMLWIIMHLHAELCRIARCLNSFFGMQMTVQMIAYFIVIIEMCSFLYHTIFSLNKFYKNNIVLKLLLSSNMWCIIFLTKLISVNHICESVSAKAQRTKDVIYKLTNLICFANVREEIYQFVFQVSLRPLKFSGLGLFYFGYDFIRKFFVWILTAVLFMVQMDAVPIPRFFFSNRFNTTC